MIKHYTLIEKNGYIFKCNSCLLYKHQNGESIAWRKIPKIIEKKHQEIDLDTQTDRIAITICSTCKDTKSARFKTINLEDKTI